MSEFSITFYFDLQRFATFTNGKIGTREDGEDEVGVLSYLFDGDGKAYTKSSVGGATDGLFWDKSAIVSLTPASDNKSVGAGISIVAGAATSIKTGGGSDTGVGHVISKLTAIDADGVNGGTVKFGTIGDIAILNPNGTFGIGNNTVTFAGSGEKEATVKAYGDEVLFGTNISVKGGEIVNATLGSGEGVTTTSGMSATFTNGGIATFASKSFGTINAFSADNKAELAVGNENSNVTITEDANNVADGKSAITAVFSGESLQSVKFDGTASAVVGSVSYGGKYNLGRDISIQGSAINVARTNLNGASSVITYQVAAQNSGYSFDPNILDVTGVALTADSESYTARNTKITLEKVGDSDFVIARDFLADDEDEDGTVTPNMTTINIAGVNYQFNDEGDVNGNGGVFEIVDGKVTGFVFRDANDAITIPKGTGLDSFNLYTVPNSGAAVDNAEALIAGLEKVTFNLSGDTGSDALVITKVESDDGTDLFEIEVSDGAAFEIENEEAGTSVGLELTLPKYQGQKGAAKIVINADGQLQSIQTVVKNSDGTEDTTTNVGGTEVKITGATADSGAVASDFTVNNVSAAVESGEFNYVVEGRNGQVGVKSIQLASADDTIGAITDTSGDEDVAVKVKPYAGTEGKVTFTTTAGDHEYTFVNSNGNAFLYADADSLRFVFVDKGDAITIPEDASATTELLYMDKSTAEYRTNPYEAEPTEIATIPVITGSDNYTVEMTTATRNGVSAAEFAVTDILADSVVRYKAAGADDADTDPTFTYSADGGTFLFGQDGDTATANGFTAESGTVTMNDAAAALLGVPDATTGRPFFKIDGTAVLINAETEENEGNILVYFHDQNGLYGLANDSVIYTAGAITKIYAPTAEGTFTFNQNTADDEEDDQIFTALGSDGDVDDISRRAYFTVDGTKATGFTFVVMGDQLTAEDFSTLTLTDAESGNTFEAPVVTEGENAASATIVKAIEDIAGVETNCYQIIREDGLQDLTVSLGETDVTFTDAEDTTSVFFDVNGKLLAIKDLYDADNTVVVENATGAVNIDDNIVEIVGGGFTYTMVDPNTPAIRDLKAGADVIQAAGVSELWTIADDETGNGTFTFGGESFVIAGYSVAEDENGVQFVLNTAASGIEIAGISSVEGNTSVTGALNGLALNGTSVAIDEATEGTQYTFSGTSFAGLLAGDKVTDAGNMTDFITAAEGNFAILSSSMAIEGDSSVVFTVAEDALSGIQDLAGTATGDFTEELDVNTETVKVTGDNSIAVSGDDSVVIAIGNIGGGSIALEQIGSASVVSTDADGTFDFVEGQQTFTTSGTSDGVSFGVEDKKVTSITGVDDGEMVTGDFSGDGISVDGSLIQVENNGVDITYVNGSHSGMTGTGIYGLQDGASVVSASGIDVAVAVGQSGTYTFGEDQTFTIANDSNNHVGFLLENGKVTGIFDVDGEVKGNLNGITINQKAPDINVVGTNTDYSRLTYSDGLLSGIVDGDTILSADNVSTVRTDGAGTFTFGSQSYFTTDEDGIDFVVKEGTTDVIGIDALASDETLTGALSGLSSINGQSVVVRNDPSYAVVGASAGIKEIFDVSDGAEVVFAGGASKVITDTEGAFTIGGKSFAINADDEVEFALNTTGNVNGINGLSGTATSDHENFEGGFTVNGLSFAITGDEDDLAVTGTQDAQGISIIGKVGGALVNINDAAGATLITTDKEGSFTFTKGGQSFLTNDTELAFTLDETEKVTEIDLLDSDITGNFTEVDTVNDQTVRVTDSDNILTITGKGGTSIAKISDVDGEGDGATITNVGGASQVVTKSAGKFTFAGHADPFETSGDDELTFDMVEGADAQVKGITGIDDGAVTGNLGDLEAINGQSFIIDNDDDNKFTYEKNGSAATVSGVAGDSVQISALAGASTVELEKDGTYTFGQKAYDIATGDAATVGVNGLTVTSIDGLDQDGESIIGDFTSNIKLGDKNFNVLGDDTITVTQEDGKLVISGLNDGAKIEAADSVLKATTEEAGTFSDTDDRTLIIGNGDVLLSLDGAAHIVAVDGVTDGIAGDIIGLPINGNSSALVNVISAPDGLPSTNVSLNGDTLSGVVAGDTVISAGPATLVVAEESNGLYQFGADNANPQLFLLSGDDGTGTLEFTVKNSSVVTAVDGVDEGATLTGELNGLSVNGGVFQINGDRDNFFGVVGDATGGIAAITDVGGGSRAVTVMSAAGAEEIYTDSEGNFVFNGSGQRFAVAGDSAIVFGLEGNASQESVTSIGDLEGTVAGDFSKEIAVNDGTIQVTGDRDGVSVVGADDTVAAINDVDAGASVVSSGNASVVGAAGEGVYTFVESNEKFTIAGDTALNFNLDNGDVIGVNSFERVGTDRALITFDPSASPTLEINPTVNDPIAVSAASGVLVTVEVDDYGRIVGVAGAEVIDGLENATINATAPIVVNGKEVDVVDADNSFNVEVENYEVKKVTGVTGNATVNVADAVVEANKDGAFQINGASYTIVDGDDTFALTTDPSKNLSAVSSLNGAIIVEDGTDDLNINGNDVTVANGGTPVTVYSDGTNITAVDGLVDEATISGALDNASIAMASVAANDANNMSILTVNDTLFALVGPDASSEHGSGYHVADLDGVTINGKGEIVGLDDGARMIATEAGLYTVNGSVINAVPGDTIFGAGEEGAYIHDPDNILVRKSTPISTIESLTGIAAAVNSVIGSYADPASKASLDSILADASVDKDRVLEIYTTNDSVEAQDIDLSPYDFSKKVHLFNGDQNLAFNDQGGNLVHVEETYRAADGNDSLTSGKKNIVFGDGGDVAVVDMARDIGNEVNIAGGAGADSIFVRNNVDTTINMSEGGADKVVTFAGANGRIALEGYNASTGAGVQFDHLSLRDAEGGIANAIEKGVIGFGDGVVSLTTSAGNTQISLNGATGGTDSLGGSVVNLFTPEGTRQQVAFTHSAGGVASVDAASTEDVIFIGNKDGKKEGGSVLRGGLGNDVAFAGEGDAVDLGDGLNVVRLQDNQNREGAFVNISAGNNAIYGTNNTLDEIHGDTLGVDLTQMELSYVDGNLIASSKGTSTIAASATIFSADQDNTLSYDTATDIAQSADLAESADDTGTTGGTSTATTDASVVAAAITSSLVPDHNYTNQLINSNGTLIKAAIGATGSVIDVKLDEDVRANYYVGDDSGLTFYGYNGDVLVDLEGDWQASRIDQQGIAVEGITSIAAGTGLNYIKGSDNNETFFAGRGNSHLYGDGGRNLLVGYEGTDKEGQTTFYLLGNAYDAANTISGFEFVDDNNYDNNSRVTADKLEVDLPTNYVNRVALSNDDVVINVTGRNGISTESAVITGAKGKDILVSGDGIVADVVAQIGDDTLTFDKFANYYNATGKNATVVVDQNNQMDYARVWLDNASLTGTTFMGDIHEINASLYAGAAELAGNDYNNTIIAGSGATSLWGGNKGDDALVAGTGQDTFYYTLGNGTDTIYGAKDGDVVNLAGVTLDQLDIANFDFSETGVKLAFKDGGVLYIGDEGGNAVSYVVEGQTYFVNENHNGFERKQ